MIGPGESLYIHREIARNTGLRQIMPIQVQTISNRRLMIRLYRRAMLLRIWKATMCPSMRVSISRVASGIVPISGMKAMFFTLGCSRYMISCTLSLLRPGAMTRTCWTPVWSMTASASAKVPRCGMSLVTSGSGL